MKHFYLVVSIAWCCFTVQACADLANRDQFPTSDAPQQTEAGRNSYRLPTPDQYRPLPD